MSTEKTRYSESELAEFKEIILAKLKEAKDDYNLLQNSLSNGNNGTDDTGRSFNMMEDGSQTLSKEETAQLCSRQEKFIQSFKPTNKIYKLKSRIFKKKNNKFLSTNKFLYFGSGVSIKNRNKKYIEFEKNKWIKINDTKKIKHYENNIFKILKLFLGTRYSWGGKTSKGYGITVI